MCAIIEISEYRNNLCEANRSLLADDAASQILNAYEHLVLLPMYENMGFDKNDFFEDQDVDCYEKFIDKLAAEGIRHNGKISVEDFITLFACIMSYMFFPIDNRFQPQLSVIKRTERDLYKIFKNFKIQLQGTPLNNQGKKQIQKVYSVFMGLLDRFIMKNCDTNSDFFRMFSII